MKNKPLSKKQINNLIDAWAEMNMLCAYLEDQEKGTKYFTEKFSARDKAKRIFKLLDLVVAKIDDEDL